jgi:HAE1 family hydrophobic/amphiphilic exporter-1
MVITRPIAISMLFLALVLIGAISYPRIPVDLLPSITYPRLTVVTVYDDIPAEDLERLVTQPLEEMVTALSGVRRLVARTREGVSLITVEYEWGTEMNFANLHLREAIDRVAFRDDFPEEAERPVILRWDPTSRPISILVLTADDRPEVLSEFAREVVKPALEQVDGISQAEIVGGTEREIRVEPDPRKLALYGLDMESIRAALVQSNISFPGGSVRQGPLTLSLRIAGEFETLGEIEETEIPRPGQASIRIRDVATVHDSAKEATGYTLLEGRRVVSLLVYKEPEANTLNVSSEVDLALAALDADYPGFHHTFVYRDADYVRASFQGLVQSLLIGSLLAFFVLFIFLHDARSPLVVGVSIPVSITIAFALLYFGKVKLNLMSLGGLSLAAGMLVDNAIVVLENINRHLERGKISVPLAAERGTAEVARAVVAATLTTIAVFFPVVYVPGVAGAFFRDQALTVTFSLIVSIAAALLLQPMLAAHIIRPRPATPPTWARGFRAVLDGAYSIYHGTLVFALRHRALAILVLIVGLGALGFLGTRLERSFMPQRSSGDMRIDLELPAGTPLEDTSDYTSSLAAFIGDLPSVSHVFTQVGRTEATLAAMQEFAGPHTANLRVILEQTRGGAAIGARVRDAVLDRVTRDPGVAVTFRDEGIGLGELLSDGGARFSLSVTGDTPENAVAAAETVADAIASVDGLTDIRVDRVLGTSTVVMRLDRERIVRAGLDPERVATELKNRIAGVEATTFNEIEQRVDVAVRFPQAMRRDLSATLEAPIAVEGDETVPLRSFVTITDERPVRELVRRNQRRMVTVQGDVSGRGLDAIWSDVDRALADLDLPEDVQFVTGGEREDVQKSFRDLGWAMILAVLLVYMILAAQFESFLDPLLIAAVIPIGIGGSIFALSVFHESLNILSLIGVLAFLGIAVNDAIIKVDTIRRLRDEGLSPHEAVMQTSRLRFRPILMTSSTTILAMVPMAIGLGSGEQLQRPLAVTIIGGLAFTTVLTLIYTPVLYTLAHRVSDAVAPARAAEPEDAPA